MLVMRALNPYTLVLDKADLLLAGGFKDQTERLLEVCA